VKLGEFTKSVPYDFSPHAGKGTFNPPSPEQVRRFSWVVARLTGRTTHRQHDLGRAIDWASRKSRFERPLAEAVSELTGVPVDELLKLPSDIRAAFVGYAVEVAR
jgi:hypothetical protein